VAPPGPAPTTMTSWSLKLCMIVRSPLSIPTRPPSKRFGVVGVGQLVEVVLLSVVCGGSSQPLFGPDCRQQTATSVLDQTIDVIEVITVVGVWDVVDIGVGGEIEETMQVRYVAEALPQLLNILTVHSDQVRHTIGDIIRPDLARAAVIRNTVVRQNPPRAWVRPLADVIRAGSRRVNLDFVRQVDIIHKFLKDRFGHRRATNIAQTNKQHPNRHSSSTLR